MLRKIKFILPLILTLGLIFAATHSDSWQSIKKGVNTLFGMEHKYWRKGVILDTLNTEFHEFQIMTPLLIVDTIYKSMMGPTQNGEVIIDQNPPVQLLWVTGYTVEIIEQQSESQLSDEYLCHNNLNYQSSDYLKIWGLPKREGVPSPKRITLAPGQNSLYFPIGFGLPIMSNEKISINAQVLNLNITDSTINMRQKGTLRYQYQKDLTKRIQPLYQQSVEIIRPILDDFPNYAETQPHENQNCSPVLGVPNTRRFLDSLGRRYTGHWIVPLGTETIKTDVTRMLNLPFNTTLHYISVHMHPFGESLTLFDATDSTIIFKAMASSYSNKIAVKHIDKFESKEGKMLYKDHNYELICVTNNTSGQPQDMMAVMYIYLYDKELDEKFQELYPI